MKKILIYFIALLAISILPLKSAFSGGHYSGPDLSGQKVVIFGPWMAPEDESFRDVVSIFEKATGATVEYGGSDEFEQIINIDCKAGNPADADPCITSDARAARRMGSIQEFPETFP